MEVQVAAIQHNIFWEDRKANLHRLESKIERAAAGGANLIVLPELFATGSTERADLVEPPNGPTSNFMQEIAQRANAWLCGSVATVERGNRYNTAVLAGPRGEMFRTRKHHLKAGGESEFFTSSLDVETFTVEDLRVTPMIGYDVNFPQEFWHAAPDTDLFVLPGAEPNTESERWETLLRARALESCSYVIGVNRVGSGGGLTYDGGSYVVDPSGEILVSARSVEAIVVAEVDSAKVRFSRDRTPLVGDRRKDVITLF